MRNVHESAVCESVLADGYAALADVFSLQETADLSQELSSHSLPRSRAGIRHLLKHESIAAFAREPRLIDLAQAVLGRDAFPFRATLFDKSPDANWLVVWHQDTALPLRQKRETEGWSSWSIKDGIHYAHAPASALEQVIAIRIHLDNSTSENGPLRVLPRTHNRGLLTDDEIHSLSLQIDSVKCVAPCGGLVLMRPLIVHASSKSQSDTPRRVLHIEYAAQGSFDGLELATA